MAGVTEFLMEHAKKDPVSFHMPGHKGKALYQKYGYGEFLERFFDCDITEIIGADNLFQTEGIIAETMGKYRELYGAKASYLLVNGTSGGIIASILACAGKSGGACAGKSGGACAGKSGEACAGKSTGGSAGGKLIMARNCHKSVFNALTLGGIQPVYAYPSVVEEYGIAGPVDAEEIARLLDENPEAGAVILPSPNYYGICSDIEAISREVHKRNRVLIVDQAHGAHLKFFEDAAGAKGNTAMPKSAESCGADIVINSTHKTLTSLTQSAVLNVMTDRVDLRILEDKLQAIESTSPSYILMASLDINADIMKEHGSELVEKWQKNIGHFYEKAGLIKGLKIMKNSNLDFTKINLDMSACGLDGGQLENELLKYEIYGELVTGNILMCMTGIGNTRKDFDRLLKALEEIAEKKSPISDGTNQPEAQADAQAAGAFLWTKKRTMHDMPVHKKLVKIEDAEGCFCAASIIPYPPGIPLICPGEEIGREEIEYVKELRARGEKVMGIDGEGRIVVGA